MPTDYNGYEAQILVLIQNITISFDFAIALSKIMRKTS